MSSCSGLIWPDESDEAHQVILAASSMLVDCCSCHVARSEEGHQQKPGHNSDHCSLNVCFLELRAPAAYDS